MLIADNHNPKCDGQDNTGNNVCGDRNRCGRFLRPSGDRQDVQPFWRDKNCQHYEIVPSQYHIQENPGEFIPSDGWNDARIEIIARNGNDGLHYEEV